MQAPFIFITTHAINDGAAEAYEAQHGAFADFVNANEPDLLSFQAWMSDDRTEVTFIFVFPDAEAADRHMEIARDKIGQGLEITRTARLETYGTPGPVLGQVLAMNAQAGVPVSIKGTWRGGFDRVAAAA